MATLGELLRDLFKKDASIHIESIAFKSKTILMNKDGSICIEGEGLGDTIVRLWEIFYGNDGSREPSIDAATADR